MRRRRIGRRRNRRLSRRTLQGLSHRRVRWATRVLGGARHPRKPDGVTVICQLLNRFLRITDRMAKEEPHLFGPQAPQYFLDTLAMERERREIEADIAKVYGDKTASGRRYVDTLWSERYPELVPHPPKSRPVKKR